MNDKVFLAVQILTGVMFIVFGITKVVQMPQPMPMSMAMEAYKLALSETGFMLQFICITEIVIGVLFILQKYVALSAIVALIISINFFLAHLFLDPSAIFPSTILTGLVLITMYRHKKVYERLLSEK